MLTVRRRGDSGAVAVLVAVCVSTFLLGVGALTVDLGSAYVTRDAMRSLADRAASAGAAQLPDTGAAVAVIEGLVRQDWPRGTPPAAGWATGAAPGSVTFSGSPVQEVRVELPPATVEFGLAAALGASSVDVSRTSQVRLSTPTGLGILPFPLLQSDLATGSPLAVRQQFCIADGGVSPPVGMPYPTSPAPNRRIRLDPTSMAYDAADRRLEIRPVAGQRLPTRGTPLVYFSTWSLPVSPRPGWTASLYVVDVPIGIRPGDVDVWIRRGAPYPVRLSEPETLQITGTAPVSDPCEATTNPAARGALDIAGGSFEQNIKQGVDPTRLDIGDRVGVRTAGFAAEMDDGFFDTGTGRMKQSCGASGVNGDGGVVDGSSIFDDAPGALVDQSIGSTVLLTNTLLGGLGLPPSPNGWIGNRALRCGRFAMMPVIDDTDPGGGYPVTGYRYVWIDHEPSALSNGNRGFLWSGTQVRGLRGYVLDSGMLPRVTTQSPQIAPYLGSGLPVEPILRNAP